MNEVNHNVSSRRVLAALDGAVAKLEAIEREKTEPIAVISMACRLPGGVVDPESYWKLLRDGFDGVCEVPDDHWPVDAYYDPDPATVGKLYTRYGGFVRGVDQFDPSFFGISPREAVSMDPQQRILLEVVWEAMERACLTRGDLEGSLSGVYIGATTNDYSRLFSAKGDFTGIDTYFGTGNSMNALAGRVSYLLGLQGPSMVIDTACSSSLVSTHMACQALRLRECDIAFAGGVNLILSPEASVALCRARMLAPDGRCKTFDASADGYGRGEGCGVVVLKRLSDAEAAGDNILGLILGSAVNQDGASSGLTVPNGRAQEALIRRALKRAGVKPCDVDYLEAHGTGTSLGDPIEIRAAGGVFGEHRDKNSPLVIGSVKTNIGHLEAAAGIAGLMKLILSLQHGEVPPHLHFKTPNPAIEWDQLSVTVPTRTQPWPARGARRLACISSFGASGTNAHLVLSAAGAAAESKVAAGTAAMAKEAAATLLVLSGKSEKGLKELAGKYSEYIGEHPGVKMGDLCFSANAGRNHFENRLSVTADSVRQVGEKLAAAARGETVEGVLRGAKKERRSVRPVFLFTGQGSQFVGMGRELYQAEKRFRDVIDRCDEALRPHLKMPLLDVLYGKDGGRVIDQTGFTQPALFALEYALADLWISWGVEPFAVIGHSVGEYAAACIAGVFSFEDGLKLIAARGRLMQSLPAGGTMVAVFAGEQKVAEMMARCSAAVDMAGINGPALTVISGKMEAVRTVTGLLEKAGVKSTELKVSHAFHSALMDPILEEFGQVAGEVAYRKPTRRLVSNVSGALAGDEVCGAGYWVKHIRSAVRFADGMNVLDGLGAKLFLEIGPRPILIGMAKACIPARQQEWLASLKPGQPDLKQMESSLGVLFTRGVDVNWAGVYANRRQRKLALPTTPFQRERFWLSEPKKSEETKDWLYEVKWERKIRRGRQVRPMYLPDPAGIAGTLKGETDRLGQDLVVSSYMSDIARLERLAARYAWKGLKDLGFNLQKGAMFETDRMAMDLSIVGRHHKLFGRMLEMLAEEGVLRREGHGWVVEKPDGFDKETGWGEEFNTKETKDEERKGNKVLSSLTSLPSVNLSLSEGEAGVELTLLTRCGGRLADVLKGACDPLQLLFPEGDMTTAARLYQDAFGARIMNELAAKAVSAALKDLPAGRVLRVLEVGAGTGGTSSYILPLLPADRTQYVFTDVSSAFTNQARAKFAAYPFVEYRVFDAEKTAVAQGFDIAPVDVVIATNVLHATKNLHATLGHVRELMQPGGLLIFVEGTAKLRFIDLIFGLTEGWWRFEDSEIRPSHPLLSVSAWCEMLGRAGFAATGSLSAAGGGSLLDKQAVIMAKAGAGVPKALAKWLLLADRDGVAGKVKEALIAEGGMAWLAQAGPEAVDPAAVARLIDDVEKEAGALDGVAHFWGLDSGAADGLSLDSLKQVQALACGSVLYTVQALLKRQKPPRLLIVTQGAVSTGLDEQLPGVVQSTAWGLGKIVSLEHPELGCVRLDLDPGSRAQDGLAILGEMIGPDGEDHLAVRDGQRYVARLARKSAGAAGDVKFNENGTYLITGGLGGLGLLVAEWMAARGAKHLVLTSRSGLTAFSTVAVEKLRGRGVTVDVAQVDVGDEQKMTELVTGLTASPNPLRGVIHSVGVLDDGALLHQTWSRFERVLDPKVRGAWILHRLTEKLPLDFFVLFSSATSLFGSSGQSNHAAANAFQDSLAAYRRARGLPGLSINWGPWAEVGAAAARKIGARVKEKGIGTISPKAGLNVLEGLFRETLAPAGPVQVGVVPVEWSQFPEKLAAMPFFANLAAAPVRTPDAVTAVDILVQVKAAPVGKRKELLAAHVRQQVAAVLGIGKPESIDGQKGFFELGMDSLTSVEFRNRLQKSLGCALSATIAFDRPTTEALVEYLLDSVVSAEKESVVAAVKEPVAQVADSELETLSNDDIGALLDAELEQIERGMR